MSKIELTTLPNGIRIITDSVKSVDSVAMGIWIDAGTRHEDMNVNGIAHMTEHMLFKGTKKRNALQIAQEIENVGGHVNAYTSRDITAYHIHLLKDDMALAADILSDMVLNSVMPDDEVERERQVILQEIGMTLDTPDDLVFDLHQERAYPDQALGAPILGTADIIKTMKRETLMDYVDRFYTGSRMVISASGHVEHDDFVKLITDLFAACPSDKDHKVSAAHYKGGELRHEKDLEQSHVIVGFQGFSRLDDQYYAMLLLSTILGGGMSSRLFQEIRENRGLAYSVFSFHYGYQDDGLFGVYAGTGPGDLPELIPAMCGELEKATHTLTEDELIKAKTQIRASTLMGRESMLRRTNMQAKHLIHHGEILNIHERLEEIETVSLDQVHKVAAKIFATTPTVTALGPLEKLEPYDQIKNRLAA